MFVENQYSNANYVVRNHKFLAVMRLKVAFDAFIAKVAGGLVWQVWRGGGSGGT